MILLAMDRASVREFDKDGRLHVEVSNISKANICPYYGREIPDWEALGLDRERLYQMYRDPEELAKAADTFNNIPLLSQHVPVTAEAPRKDLVIGTTGSDCTFVAPYLQSSLAVWDKVAIDLIEDDQQRELSSAYHYRADMTPGSIDGLHYDGIMRDIIGNHVALVAEGRAGPDVVVGDEHMLKSRKALMVSGAVAALVRPKLAQDAKVDLTGLFGGVTAKNLKAQRSKLAKSVVAAALPHLAADAALDEADILAAIDTVHSIQLAQDEKDEIAEDADDEDDDIAEDEDGDEDGKAVAEDEDGDDDKDDKPAMDAATVHKLIRQAEARGAKRMVAIRTAEKDVFPLVGEIVAQDSAEAVYRMALDSVGVPAEVLKGAPIATLKVMVEREVSYRTAKPRVAMDSARGGTSVLAKIIPDIAPLIRS